MFKLFSVVYFAVCASAANWGAISSITASPPSTVTVIPTSVLGTLVHANGSGSGGLCAVYYGWDDSLSSATLIATPTAVATGVSTIYIDPSARFTAPGPDGTTYRENWGHGASSVSASATIAGPFYGSFDGTATVIATVFPSTYTGPAPPGATGIPPLPPCPTVVGTGFGSTVTATQVGGAPTSTSSANAQGTSNLQAQGQDSNTGAGYITSVNAGALALVGAVGVALAL